MSVSRGISKLTLKYMTNMKIILNILSFLCFCGILHAQKGYEKVDLLINSTDGVYHKGDSVIVWAEVAQGGSGEIRYRVRKNKKDIIIDKNICLNEGRNILYAEVHNERI